MASRTKLESRMDDNTLVGSSFSATTNAPLERCISPLWCFTLPESKYQAYSLALLYRRCNRRTYDARTTLEAR